MKKVLIVIGALALCLGLFAGLVAFYIYSAEEIPLSDLDKKTIITAQDLEVYYDGFKADENFALLSKIKYIDGSTEIEYEYQPELIPYINNNITVERNVHDAKSSLSTLWYSFSLTIKAMGMEFEENKSFFSMGENSRFADIKQEGQIVGHFFVTRKDKTVYMFTISGYTMTDVSIWQELFEPRLAAL